MTVYIPEKQELILCAETVAGTPATTGGILCLPEVGSLSSSVQGSPIQGNFAVGKAISNFDRQPIARNSAINFSTWYRSAGEINYLIAAMLGLGSDTVAGAGDPYTHTMKPSLSTTVGKAYTAYHDTGDGTSMLQMAMSRPSQLDFSFAPEAAMMANVQMMAFKAAIAAAPTIATRITDIPILGFQGTVTIPSSTPTVAYTCILTGAQFSLTRGIGLCKGITNASVQDIVPGPLSLTGSLTFQYDGLSAGLIHADFLAQARQGTSAHPATVKFTDTNGHFWQLDFWPFLLDDLSLGTNQTYLEGTIQLGPFNDLTVGTQASVPAATSPVDIIVANSIAGAYA